MQTIHWYRLLALGLLAAPIASQAQGPQPKITEIATIPGAYVDAFVKMPNGRVIVYSDGDSLFAYDLTTKRRTFIARDWDSGLAISPRGDRIAYGHNSEDHKSYFLWAIAINPATGAPTGAAQRVTTSSGDSPSFSPDGTLIAFDMDKPNGARGQNLAVVPVRGGMQRVLAEYDKPIDGATSWSADGKWIYVQLNSDSIQSIERVPVAGGKGAKLFSYRSPAGTDGSVDGQLAFFRPDAAADSKGRVAYVTASGGHGEFQIPPGAFPGTNKGVPRTLLQVNRPNLLHILDLATGTLTNVPTPDPQAHFVSMSPDGKHLAYVTGAEHRERVLLNVDGTGQRRFPVPDQEHLAGISQWTPDGDGVEFFTDSGRTFRKLSFPAGASRVIATLPAPSRFFTMPLQQPDGKPPLAITYEFPLGARSHSAVVELHPDGSRSSVRDLSAEFQHIRLAVLTSSTQALLEIGDSAAGIPTEYVFVPLPHGPARRVPMPALESGVQLSVLPSTGQFEGKWFVANMVKDNQLVGFLVMSTETDSTRVFRFPARTYLTGWAVAPMLRDNKELVTFARTGADDDSVTVYALPLDGTARRVIARIPDPRTAFLALGNFGLSADSRSFAFFSAGPPTSHLYDVDLTPILNLVKKP